MVWQMTAAVLIVGFGFLLILAEIWNRTLVAIGCALFLIVIEAVPLQDAWNVYMNWDYIIFWLGIYITSELVQRRGIVPYLAMKLVHKTGAKPLHMLLMLCTFAAAGSALFDGLVMMAALIPFTISLVRILRISPIPFLIGEMLASNIGGTATWIGNMPNRLIGTAAKLSYFDFIVAVGPLMLLLLLLLLGALTVIYRHKYMISDSNKKELLQIEPASFINNRQLFIQSSILLGIMIVVLSLHELIEVNIACISIIGALCLLILHYKEAAAGLNLKEWKTISKFIIDSQILFFIGLFTMAGSLVHTGVIRFMTERALEITQGNMPFLGLLLVWVSGIGSAAIDQVPYTASIIPFVKEAGLVLGMSGEAITPLWWSLSIGAGIGGGATLIGTSVNMLASGIALRDNSALAFWDFAKVAVPLTVLFLIISSIYLNIFIY